MTPEEQLLAAADDMAEHGHNKETYFGSAEGWEMAPACALGSLARVTGQVSTGEWSGMVDDSIRYSEAAIKLARQIAKTHPYFGLLGDAYKIITTYNDANTTTAEDMILTMKEAAHG